MSLLSVENLNVGFRQDGQLVQAVRGVSFTLAKGETLALVGESGSGKSVTALSTVSLLGDTAQVTGSVRYAGQEMIGAPEARLQKIRGNDISFIFQEPMTSLNPLHTIEAQITESLALHQGLSGPAARARGQACVVHGLHMARGAAQKARGDGEPHAQMFAAQHFGGIGGHRVGHTRGMGGQQLLGIGMLRVGEDFSRRPLFDNLAALHHANAVGNALHDGQIVGDEKQA